MFQVPRQKDVRHDVSKRAFSNSDRTAGNCCEKQVLLQIAHMGGRLLRRHQGIESTSCEGKGQTPRRNRVKISSPSAGALDEDRPLGFGKGRLFAITISKIPRRIRFIGRKPYSPTRTRMPVSAWLRLILRELLACSCTLLGFPKRKT